MKKLISTIIALVILITLSSCGNTQKAKWSEHLEAGQKFLLDGNYEQAIIEFNKVIEIEPRNVDAYLGLADVYVAQGDYAKAIEVLEKGYAQTESTEIQRRINDLKGISSVQTGVTEQTEPPVTTVTEATTEVTTLVDPDPVAEDFAWTFEDGVLTISGHGRMPDYNSGGGIHTPWYDISEEIKEVVIESGITSIGVDSFYSCDSLARVTMPDSVTSIGAAAFNYCDSLTSITIPDSVISIGDNPFFYYVKNVNPFGGCDNLTEILVNNNAEYCSVDGVLYNKDKTELISCPAGIQSNNYNIPTGVTSIKELAFYGCNLTSIMIPDSVTSIGQEAFDCCYRLTEIVVNKNNAEYCSIDGVLFTKDMTELITYPRGKQSDHYDIPIGVTSIGQNAFEYCDSLTSITIPYGVTSIGFCAFGFCYSLTSIIIPDSVTSIGQNAFLSCSLTSITIPDGVISIAARAFNGCHSLTSITISDGVTNIGDCAFGSCDSLTSITIPDSVTSMGWDVFRRCDSLTSITIPESVTNMGGYAFSGCSSLTDIYCEAESQPAGWADGWLEDCPATVHWGYKG